ncbi:MAG: Glu-tRNA(Gln) amidotransferase subunit GatE [archaeon]
MKAPEFDYHEIGLKVGLEVHQQLDTKAKMFCACPTRLSLGEPEITFVRRLRPTQSELGQIDPAALFEFQRGKTVLYEANKDTSCLVEMDEEPPHELNSEAVEVALTAALLTKSNPIDEVHVMRKIVIDGSNTTGFQRTCIVATGGSIQANSVEIPLTQISLEEDAARKISEKGMTVQYRIDRLGIPLIEITTAPCGQSPAQAEEMAFAIGRLLRATKKVKRGLGTIRQDLNISISKGSLIEIKGVQRLDLISKAVQFEVQRQLELLNIAQELKTRGLTEELLREDFVDVGDCLRESKSRMIGDVIHQGGIVLAVKLPFFGGLLKRELEPGLRLGSEMSHRGVFWGGVGGILHSDELPGYGISEEELAKLKAKANIGSEDAIVLVADSKQNCIDALKAVVARAKEALHGVPEETRVSNEDGTTKYMRPRPGSARMYPETDVPPIQITSEALERIRSQLPPLPDTIMEQLVGNYHINRKLAEQLLNSEYIPLFETLAKSSRVAPSFIATILTEVLKALERDGLLVDTLSDSLIIDSFTLVEKGITAKESLPDVLAWLCKNSRASPEQAVEALSLKMMDERELELVVDDKIKSGDAMIRQMGESSSGRIMGLVMAEVRGKADPVLVTEMVRRKILQLLSRSATS